MTEAFYKLVDHAHKVEIVWPFNSSHADIYTIPEGVFVGTVGILMAPSPHISLFQRYVESIIEQVLEGHRKAGSF